MPKAPGQGRPRDGSPIVCRPGGRSSRRGIAGAAALLVTAGTLAACGGEGSGSTPTLTWYINPDSGGQAEIASRCSEASDGRYNIEVAQLPRTPEGQREQ